MNSLAQRPRTTDLGLKLKPSPPQLLVAFTVPGNPVPKARARVVRRGAYTPARTVQAEDRIQQYLFFQYPRLRPVEGRVSVRLMFHLKGAQRGDWDNYGKLVSDALNGIVWHDDRQVTNAMVVVQTNAVEPRTEIEVYLIERPAS